MGALRLSNGNGEQVGRFVVVEAQLPIIDEFVQVNVGSPEYALRATAQRGDDSR